MERQDVAVGFGGVDQTAAPAFFIRFLDECNELESARACKRKMSELLKVTEGQSVLEVGCGVGDDARSLASTVGPEGWVVAIDRSQAMLAEARRRTGGLYPSLQFRVGDAGRLDFVDATFDACRAERVLMHLDEPQCALNEMVRVTKCGGRVVVFDLDWETLVINSSERELTRKITRLMCDGISCGWIGRQLLSMFREAGLADISVIPHTMTAPYDFWTQTLGGPLERAQQAGQFSSAEIDAWWVSLEEADRGGNFIGTLQGFIVAGQKL